jgi:hypothetical protein
MTTKKTKTQNEDPQTEASLLPVTPAPEAADLTPSQALVLAVAGCANARALRINPHFRSKYFALSDLLDIVKPTFAKYGLAIIQIPSTDDGRISISAQVFHTSGHSWDFKSVGIKSEGLTLQALGSAMSYLKRYQLATLCGVAADLEEGEDDGNSVSKQQLSYKAKASAPAIGQGNYQRQEDKKTTSLWCDWLTTTDELQVAQGILVRKGWLAPDAALADLPEQYAAQLRQPSMRQAFAKAVETELSQTNG